jgi:ABC-2 type transport system permease protein
MNRPGTIGWFALNEARLAWRDWLSLMSGGGRRRTQTVAIGFTVFAVIMHGLAWLMLYSSASRAGSADDEVLSSLSGALLLAWSLMVSQGMETVTKAFFARGDLELILTSPAAASRLFAVRLTAMAATVVVMALLLAVPFIHVLVWLGGPRWFAGYFVVVAMAINATAVAIVIIVAMFHLLGARRTRGVSQIVAAVIGAAFAIALQFATILAYGSMPDVSFSQMTVLVRSASNDHVIRWPAPEILTDPVALAALLGLSIVALAVVIYVFAPRFGQFALAAGNVSHAAPRRRQEQSVFRGSSPAWALRRKEWVLLLRDPWLMSQTLMQMLYLLPPAFLLWKSFEDSRTSVVLLVPVLVMAAGQLAGGLAWLAISGEDAPDLIATAPLTARQVTRAKIEAVIGCIALVFAPFLLALALLDAYAAIVAALGIGAAAAAATSIQLYFRAQAKRSQFRRRQTSSRVATFAEAFSSISWAGAAALAAAGTAIAIVPAILAVAILAGVRLVRPKMPDAAVA